MVIRLRASAGAPQSYPAKSGEGNQLDGHQIATLTGGFASQNGGNRRSFVPVFWVSHTPSSSAARGFDVLPRPKPFPSCHSGSGVAPTLVRTSPDGSDPHDCSHPWSRSLSGLGADGEGRTVRAVCSPGIALQEHR
jgi:hypothetical protein